VPVVALGALLHARCARQRIRCRGEHDHEPVAEVLHLGAAGLSDGLSQNREVATTKLVRSIRSQTRRQRRRPHHVGE
jgi:hypothetical protein